MSTVGFTPLLHCTWRKIPCTLHSSPGSDHVPSVAPHVVIGEKGCNEHSALRSVEMCHA